MAAASACMHIIKARGGRGLLVRSSTSINRYATQRLLIDTQHNVRSLSEYTSQSSMTAWMVPDACAFTDIVPGATKRNRGTAKREQEHDKGRKKMRERRKRESRFKKSQHSINYLPRASPTTHTRAADVRSIGNESGPSV